MDANGLWAPWADCLFRPGTGCFVNSSRFSRGQRGQDMGMINQFSCVPRFLTSIRVWLALAILLAGSFSISVAQEQPAPVEADGAPAAALFEELPIIERFGSTARQTNGKSVIKIKLGKDEALEATDWEFFDGYFFAEMTHLDKLGELDKKRVDFFKN